MAAIQLSEYEGAALRDHAVTAMRARACNRLLAAGRKDGSAEFEHDRMVGASEVFAVLDGALPAFQLRPSETAETIKVTFTEMGMEWLEELRGEVRRGLKDSRGSTEVNENAPAETFLPYVLDGICRGES